MSKPKTPSLTSPTSDAPQGVSQAGCLVRAGWMLVSNVALLLCAAAIAQTKALFSAADAIFWVIAVGAVTLRYFDVKMLHGQTATGEPATMAHWRRYAVFFPAASLGIWLLAHAIARLSA